MVTEVRSERATCAVAVPDIDAALTAARVGMSEVLARFADPLPDTVDPGGWDVRHLLSHMLGAWQRVPIHGARFLDGDPAAPVPIQEHHSYWRPEWATAKVADFERALGAAHAANLAFVEALDPELLDCQRPTPLGELSLGEFLLHGYERHLVGMHLPQLAAFLT